MKYFVQLRPHPSDSRRDDNSLALDKEIIAYIAGLQQQGALEVGYTFVTGGGFGVVNVTSHEALWEIIYNYPGTASFQWHVEPLAEVAQVFNRAIEIQEQEANK